MSLFSVHFPGIIFQYQYVTIFFVGTEIWPVRVSRGQSLAGPSALSLSADIMIIGPGRRGTHAPSLVKPEALRSGTPSRREPEPRRLRVAASPLAGAARAAAAVRSGPPAGGAGAVCCGRCHRIESPSTSKAQLELEAVRVSALCIVRVRVIARMLFESCQCITREK
jgi:hypothetical protein